MHNSSINITASSYQKNKYWDREPHFVMSNDNGKFWANENDDFDPWIQVNLGATYVVKELVTKGHTGSKDKYWVEMIKIKVGMSEECMNFIKDEDGLPKVRFSKWCDFVIRT